MTFNGQKNPLILPPVCGCGEFYHHSECHLSKVVPQTNEAGDFCPGRLCMCLPHGTPACKWGKLLQPKKKKNKKFTAQKTGGIVSHVLGLIQDCLLQGGIYIFQFFDYYASTRICGYFYAICECLALGWIFGETGSSLSPHICLILIGNIHAFS